MAAIPPPPPPPPPGNHGAGPSHYNDENAGLDLPHHSGYGPGGEELGYILTNLTQHINVGLANARRGTRQYLDSLNMEVENRLFDENNRRFIQHQQRLRAAQQQADQQRRADFQANNRIEPYVPPPIPGFVNPLAEFGIPLRTQANTQFNTNGVNPR